MSELDIYKELFSKIQENKDEIETNDLDSFKAVFHDGDTILETWVRNELNILDLLLILLNKNNGLHT